MTECWTILNLTRQPRENKWGRKPSPCMLQAVFKKPRCDEERKSLEEFPFITCSTLYTLYSVGCGYATSLNEKQPNAW